MFRRRARPAATPEPAPSPLLEAETRLAFDAGHMGSWHWTPATGEVRWSPELERLLGLAPGTFPGTLDAFADRVHREDRERVVRALEGAVTATRPISLELRVVRPDGAVRWLEARGQTVPESDGEEWVGVAIDITDRKRVEEEHARLHAVEQRARADAERATVELEATVSQFDTILTNAPVGFGFYDTEFRYVGLNEALAQITGMSVEDHIGRKVADVVPDVWTRVEPIFRQVLETGERLDDVEVSGQTAAAPGVERHWLASVYPVVGPDGERVGLGSVVLDITERKRAERATRILGGASELFASEFTSELDLDTVMDRAVRLAIPDFADSCHLYLAGAGRGRRVAMADVDPELEPLLIEADVRYPADLTGDLPTASALREGRTKRIELVTDDMRIAMAQDEHHLELLRRHGVCSVLATPLRLRRETIGVLVLMHTERSGRRYQPADTLVAEALAGRLALAIESARLGAEARRATAQLEILARLGELATTELDSRARLARVARLVVPDFGDLSAVHVDGGDGRLHLTELVVADGEGEGETDDAEREWPSLPVDGESTAARAFRTQRPALLERVSDEAVDQLSSEAERQVARRLGIRSLLSVPLAGPEGTFGVFTLGYTHSGRRYSETDLPLAREVARRAASAVEAARRYERERDTAEILQRSLLPERLPSSADLEVTARYLAGGAELKIGGDWYDVLPLRDGTIMLAIGDVVGHGVRAAASMGKIRNALQFCALDELSPSETLARLNDYFSAFDDSDMATLLVARYAPPTRLLTYASAGHPPPLVAWPDGRLEYLQGGRGAPLVAADSSDYAEVTVTLAPEATLLLYTDGLIERRRESLDEGFRRLADVVSGAPEKLDDLADHLLDRLVGSEEPDDDVALLAARIPTEQRLRLRLPPEPRVLSGLRHSLRKWLTELGATRAEVNDIVLAVDEAASNAVEHSSCTEVGIDGERIDGTVVVAVHDDGHWVDRAPVDDRGRGLKLMRVLMDAVEVSRRDNGTEVRLRHHLGAVD